MLAIGDWSPAAISDLSLCSLLVTLLQSLWILPIAPAYMVPPGHLHGKGLMATETGLEV